MKDINSTTLLDIKDKLAIQIKKYVCLIRKEYSEIMPQYIKDYLDGISNFKNIISIEQTNTISMFVRNGEMFFPINAFQIISYLKKIPGHGINRNHKTCTKENIISNDNRYSDYIKHVFIAGLTPLQFYEETLLHETTHLCGIGGVSALREGFAELKTRELAQKYNLKTSACGYPKEIKIALELQNIFGKEIGNRIAFATSNLEIFNMLESLFGKDAANLFIDVQTEMEHTFSKYYSKSYPGLLGPLLKTKEYEKIDYSNVYSMIDNYKENLYVKLK
jgi:hypothetical protein